jgi:carboxyl-terminal processing protease
MSPRRTNWALTLLACSVVLLSTSRLYALPEKEIRVIVEEAQKFEGQGAWKEARDLYEMLLSQKDPGLRIRERYHNAQRRLLQTRRHQDESYRKEVLSIDFGQAIRVFNVISDTLLEASIEKKKIDSTKLFQKGLEEFEAALANPGFVDKHIPPEKRIHIDAFRAALKKTWGDMDKLSRKEAAKQIREIAMAAESVLDLSATVVAMEFACGACYAIDNYTAYLTPNQLRELTHSLSRAEVIDVGLTVGIRENNVVIHEVAMDSQAKGFVRANDQILSVDKKPVVDLPLQTVKEMLKGAAGSFVEIEVLTPGAAESRTLRLQRRRQLDLGIGYYSLKNSAYWNLEINGFTDATAQDVDSVLDVMQKQGMKGLILDLRGNGGGVFESAIDTARLFLSDRIITSTQHQNPALNRVYRAAKNARAVAVPMVVLVDGNTASAAELLAGALKDNDRATLIGQTTFGKGCSQTVLELPRAGGGVPTGGMRLTVARFFSPTNQPYCGRGVIPHIFIDDPMPQSEADRMMPDPYYDRAVEELDRLIGMAK